MRERLFKFKHFQVSHSKSAMKVGSDSVLLGAWADLSSACSILDVGSGCGLLSLMSAQRNKTAIIDAIELTAEGAAESKDNFEASPWSDRLHIFHDDFIRFAENRDNRNKYEFIISNPPYFDSGGDNILDNRMIARHQGNLSPSSLLSYGQLLLKTEGVIAMVLPRDIGERLLTVSDFKGFELKRLCIVRGRKDLPVKRILIEFKKTASGMGVGPKLDFSAFGAHPEYDLAGLDIGKVSCLVLDEQPGVPTQIHKTLCRDFYLKW